METECRKMLLGFGVALMLAVTGCDDRKTNEVPMVPTNAPHVATDVVASKKKQNPLGGFFLMLTFLIILGVITVIFILKKLRDQNRGMIANRITKANRRLKEGAGGLNESIDKIMTAGEEISGYFDVSKIPIVSSEHTEIPAPQPVKAVYEPAPPLRYNDDEDFF